MKLQIAKTAGFCMGVKRAVDIVLDVSNQGHFPIYTYGPLIHNPQVLSLLEEKGIFAINPIPEKGKGTILIRAHGVPPKIQNEMVQAGFIVRDATCPRVSKVQAIIKKHKDNGFDCIIIGDKDHPEVKGLLGYSDDKGYVIRSVEDFLKLPRFKKAIIVAQTTQNKYFFEDFSDFAKKNFPEYKLYNTICDATEKRQTEVVELAKSTDVMVVVGGRNSGNTKRLVEMAKKICPSTYHIEDESDLDIDALSDAQFITIAAGASTPTWVIQSVYKCIESSFLKKDKGIHKRMLNALYFLLRTNIFLALGAGFLSYLCSKLNRMDYHYLFFFISFFHIFSMYIFNNLTTIKSDQYNDPVRANFYQQYKKKLLLFGFVIGVSGLISALYFGVVPFLILFGMSLLGLLYNIKIFPKGLFGKYRKIKNIPGSKTLFISGACGMVSILPAFATISEKINVGLIVAFILSFGMVFTRTTIFDIFDIHGDKFVGRETIPILLGEKKTYKILKYLQIFIFIMLLLSSITSIVTNLGLVLLLCPTMMFFILKSYEKGNGFSGFKTELLIESQLIIAGMIAMIGSFV